RWRGRFPSIESRRRNLPAGAASTRSPYLSFTSVHRARPSQARRGARQDSLGPTPACSPRVMILASTSSRLPRRQRCIVALIRDRSCASSNDYVNPNTDGCRASQLSTPREALRLTGGGGPQYLRASDQPGVGLPTGCEVFCWGCWHCSVRAFNR